MAENGHAAVEQVAIEADVKDVVDADNDDDGVGDVDDNVPAELLLIAPVNGSCPRSWFWWILFRRRFRFV